jgi:hypothetical protein
MQPIRTGRRADEQLANIPTLSREELQNLAAWFELEAPFQTSDVSLRTQLTSKADEMRDLKSLVSQMNDQLNRKNEEIEKLATSQFEEQANEAKRFTEIPFLGKISCGVPIEIIYQLPRSEQPEWVAHGYGKQEHSATKRPFYLATVIDFLEEALDQVDWKRVNFLLPAAMNFLRRQTERKP